MLELRLAEGLDVSVLTETEQDRIPDLVVRGLAQRDGQKLILTLRGRLLADGVIRELLD